MLNPEFPSNSDGLTELPYDPDFSFTDDNVSYPLIDDSRNSDFNDQPQVSFSEMLTNLNSLSNLAISYLDIGKSEEDNYLIKTAGYVRYYAGYLVEQLENGGTLDMVYYTEIVARMNTLLSDMVQYLETGDSTISQTGTAGYSQEEDRQIYQDYVYSQNGIS